MRRDFMDCGEESKFFVPLRGEGGQKSVSVVRAAKQRQTSAALPRLRRDLPCQTQGEGPSVSVLQFHDERMEAEGIAMQLAGTLKGRGKLENCAILFRTNKQAKDLEEALVRRRHIAVRSSKHFSNRPSLLNPSFALTLL